MPGFEPNSRARSLERLSREVFDLLVVGGGITGAGVAREAALTGLSLALVEARDFAAGTSSRSSKLIHGGLRYLEQGELSLVREAATERKSLRRIAPHLIVVAPMLVPVYGRTAAGLYKLRAGLTLYDRLAGVPAEERHRILSAEEAVASEPLLARGRLQGAALYPEYVTDDARLVLDTLKSAHLAGAAVVNYARVTALGAADGLRTIGLRDEESGCELTARARVVVNAAGPWVDALRALDEPDARPRLHLSKGIHLVFRARDLPLRQSVVMPALDGRPIFTVPRGPFVYLGTTDTSYAGPLDEPLVSAEDAHYLLTAMRRTLPSVAIGPREVVGTWAGLRPLVRQEGKPPSEISRRDEITVSTSGLVTIAGGKLTTYRRMAERVLKSAARLLGRAVAPAGTAQRRLPGGDLGPGQDVDAYLSSRVAERVMQWVPRDAMERLLATHGSDAPEILALVTDPASLRPLAEGVPLSAAEVRHAVRHEMARTVVDVLERRSPLSIFATESAREVAPAVADLMAGELGWSAERRAVELTAFDRLTRARLAWRDACAMSA